MHFGRSVGSQFDMGKASLADAFVRIIKALSELAMRIIKLPSHEDIQRITQKHEDLVLDDYINEGEVFMRAYNNRDEGVAIENIRNVQEAVDLRDTIAIDLFNNIH